MEQVGQHVHAPWVQCCWWSHSGSAEGLFTLLWKGNSSLCRQVDIGTREIVGYGANGEVTYIDSVMAPFPAIRSTTEFKQYQS